MANVLGRLAAKFFGFSPIYTGFETVAFDWGYYPPSPTQEEYRRALAEAYRSSAVMVCIEYLIANGTATPWCLKGKDGQMVDSNPVLDLLNRPRPGDDATALLSGFYYSLALSGNAFAKIVRTRGGGIGELHYLPHTNVGYKLDKTGRIEYYRYRVQGRQEQISLEDMLHIRRYIDWQRPFSGMSPLAFLAPEVWLDIEATNYVAAILKRRGTPGGVLAPENDDGPATSPEDLSATREYLEREYTGDKRGQWLVLGRAMKVTPFRFDPHSLDMKTVHDYCEERISAGFGFPAAVVGFGTGLEQTKVGATLSEQERQAWQGGIIPVQNLIASQVTRKLLDEDSGLMLDFDRSAVTVLQEDENEKAERTVKLVTGGVMLRSDGREAHGLESKPSDEVYLQGVSVVEREWGVTQEEADEAAAERRAEQEPTPEEFDRIMQGEQGQDGEEEQGQEAAPSGRQNGRRP